jgi:hypothetical protein
MITERKTTVGTPVGYNKGRQGLLAAKAEAESKLAAAAAELEDINEDLQYYVPVEPLAEDVVIRFRKYGLAYTFAAIRIITGIGDAVWYITQDGTRPQSRKAPKTWGDLLEWIGERNWGTIAVLS